MELTEDYFETQDLYFVNTNKAGFRPGVPALVTGVKSLTPNGLNPRIVYVVRYSDGTVDHCPFAMISSGDAILTTMDTIMKGEIFKTLS
jgi:hypothetical protein